MQSSALQRSAVCVWVFCALWVQLLARYLPASLTEPFNFSVLARAKPDAYRSGSWSVAQQQALNERVHGIGQRARGAVLVLVLVLVPVPTPARSQHRIEAMGRWSRRALGRDAGGVWPDIAEAVLDARGNRCEECPKCAVLV